MITGTHTTAFDPRLKRTVQTVFTLNLAYFGVEFAVALSIGSVSLFADSADFLEDAALNLLILMSIGWTARRRAYVGMALACLLLIPAIAFVWALTRAVLSPESPEAVSLTLTAAGALAVNSSCALLLARYRNTGGSVTKATFLSSRNDVFANLAIIAAGLITLKFPSVWPDAIAGLGIAALNLDAAKTVWAAARSEQRTAV